jgi:hypothetical protein
MTIEMPYNDGRGPRLMRPRPFVLLPLRHDLGRRPRPGIPIGHGHSAIRTVRSATRRPDPDGPRRPRPKKFFGGFRPRRLCRHHVGAWPRGNEHPGQLVTERMRRGKMSWFDGREMSSLWVGRFPVNQDAADRRADRTDGSVGRLAASPRPGRAAKPVKVGWVKPTGHQMWEPLVSGWTVTGRRWPSETSMSEGAPSVDPVRSDPTDPL